VPRSISDPISTNDVNIKGTLNLLHASVENNVRRFIFASSSSVYGNQPESPKVESMTPMPISPYAVSKITGEYYCKVFQQLYGLETVSLRYFNVFGPNQDPTSQYAAVIPKFIRMMLAGQRPTIFGDGQQSRDFTFVANNVEANLLACDSPNGGGKVFNIACGGSFTLLDLVTEINAILGTNIEPLLLEARNGDILHSKANIQRAQSDLLYQAKIGFREGLERTIQYIKETEFNN
jgi:UDP-glucose 4-epimerase